MKITATITSHWDSEILHLKANIIIKEQFLIEKDDKMVITQLSLLQTCKLNIFKTNMALKLPIKNYPPHQDFMM
jgi:hypothetical protein